ncbi:FAD-dependent oxidoreductase [Gordonia sp. HY002]|uniref:NAD(P)/FAD-dependent oxidoreductase n=1 Tax=Gordonia zhenghanii TaxID=2911516 RepID=UPI001EF129CA|nr:FAD-dependent oxidoreductase [Gordonia zhenghanii]MCF8570977.1 FAD-dependent oxidoreductase [Gordonia zhenghanii]MCF8604720.1 FAD-dependent oxidoreductase [Gordonia zhenghanii]
MSIKNIAVVGTGHAATSTARSLRRRGFDGSITLIGDDPHEPYQRPPLSKEYLAGDADGSSIALFTPKMLAQNDIAVRSGVRVDKLDVAGRTLELSAGGSFTADAVVLATGGRPRTLPDFPPGAPGVHYLRSFDDAARLRDRLRAGNRLAIIGGGFIGLELAATARDLGLAVTVVEAGTRVLEPRLGSRLAEFCADLHREAGVDLRCGEGVSSVERTVDGMRLHLAGGTAVDVDDVVVAVGMVQNTGLASAAGLQVDNGIVVDACGRTASPGVFAVGDVASRYSESAGRHVRVEHVDNANRQGAVVARALLGEEEPDDSPPWFWSDQYEFNIQFTGDHRGADELVIRGTIADSEFSAFYLCEGRLAAAFAVDRGEDVVFAREMLGASFDKAMLADQDIDLWELSERSGALA